MSKDSMINLNDLRSSLDAARRLRKDKKIMEAIELYKKIYMLDSKPVRFYKDYAVALRFEKDLDACFKIIDEGLRAYPKKPSLLIEKAMAYRDENDYVSSLLLFQKIMREIGYKLNKLNSNRYRSVFNEAYSSVENSDKLRLKKVVFLTHVSFLIKNKCYREAFDFCYSNNNFFNLDKELSDKYNEVLELSNQHYLLDGSVKKRKNIAIIPSGNQLWNVLPSTLYDNYDCNIVFSLGYPNNNRIQSLVPSCEIYNVNYFSVGVSLTKKDFPFSPGSEILRSRDFLDVKSRALKIMDRQDALGHYRMIDREAVFYSMFLYFYSMLKEKKVLLVLAGHAPHVPSSYTLFETARLMGIKTACFMQNTLVPGFELRSDFFGSRYESYSQNNFKDNVYDILKNYVSQCSIGLSKKAEPGYMVEQKRKDKEAGVVFKKRSALKKYSPQVECSLNPNLPPEGKLKWGVESIGFLYSGEDEDTVKYGGKPKRFKSRARSLLLSEYNNIIINDDLIPEKYVFVPLHYEPEKTSTPDGGSWCNTYDMIIALRELVPDDVTLIVKEHYSQFTAFMQGHKARSPYFYRAVSSLPNVEFVDFEINSPSLIEGSLFVASQTGTACLEAACSGNKSLLFGYPWFYGCPNAFNFDDVECYSDIINCEVKSSDEVLLFMRWWVNNHYIYGALTGSDMSNANKSYPESRFLFNDIYLTATELAKTLEINGFFKE